MRLPARQALRKDGRKGKREEREKHSFSHFSFPLPFFAPATQAISEKVRLLFPESRTTLRCRDPENTLPGGTENYDAFVFPGLP